MTTKLHFLCFLFCLWANIRIYYCLPAENNLGYPTETSNQDDWSKCSTECSEGFKYAYVEGQKYVYTYEATNKLRMVGSSEITTSLRATVGLVAISACEYILQIDEASVVHGSKVETASTFIDDLKREPLHFSWDNGVIKHLCPNPNDDPRALNIKRGILSALQNSMKNLKHELFARETDIFGSCSTDYRVKHYSFGDPKVIILKGKDLDSCSQHLKGKTAFSATFYDSELSLNQDLPLLSNRSFGCTQIINNGIVEEVTCKESGKFQAISELGYQVDLQGEIKMQYISVGDSPATPGKITSRQSLGFHFESKRETVQDSVVESALRDLCPKVVGLLEEDVGLIVHQLVHLIRGMSKESVEKTYNHLKSGELCKSPKALGIYLDALKAAETGGAVHLLTKLAVNHEIAEAEVTIWLALMPFFGNPDEETVKATVPLLAKSFGSRQAILSVSAMTYKFCSRHLDCESVPAVKEVISSLDILLGDNCKASTDEEMDEVITALKAFGNLGHYGDSRNKLLECVSTQKNDFVRITAVEAFRRSSCNDEVRSKLLEFFVKGVEEESAVRIPAFLILVKCPSTSVLNAIHETYTSERSKQVSAFVWSYFNNLKSSSDPSKRQLKSMASGMFLKKPEVTDFTKFSRNFDQSVFLDTLNLGGSIESNLIYTQNSFLPRSLNVDFKVDLFGYKLNLFEIGFGVEDVEFILEHFFGTRGIVSLPNLSTAWPQLKEQLSNYRRNKRDISAYQQKFDTFDERVKFLPWRPKGYIYYRVFGNEFRWRKFDNRTVSSYGDFDLNVMLKRLEQYKHVDVAHSAVFFDTTILIPSVTGRDYKLASNGSVTLGLKATGNVNVQSPALSRLTAKIDMHNQPSAVVQLSASLSLHSEKKYEPGVRVSTTFHVGQDVHIKAEVTNGRHFSRLLNFPNENNKIFSLKREFYIYDQDGERIINAPKTHNFEYCTKYIDKILGLHFCWKSTISHGALGGPMKSELTMQKIDKSMRGFEFILELPELEREDESNFKISIDTPGSSINRKLSTELQIRHPSPDKSFAGVKLYSPFYTFEASGTYVHRSDLMELKIEADGDKKRFYKLDLHVEKDMKGARLAEFRPTLKLSLPFKKDMVFSGNIVLSRGRKEQATINMQSDSFGFPIVVRGNVARERDALGMNLNYRLSSDITLISETGTFRLYGGTSRQIKSLGLDVALDYEVHGKPKQTIKTSSKIDNLHFGDPCRFSTEMEVKFTEYPDYNALMKWDFSTKFMEHLKNDISVRYGPNFNDDKRAIHFKQANSFAGDFQTFEHMNIENELGLTFPAILFDKSIAFTWIWDFDEKPKLHIDVGAKFDKNIKLGIELSYLRLSKQPIKISTEAKLHYFFLELAYRDQVQEISPNELQGRVLMESNKRPILTVDYTYKMKSGLPLLHHEFEGSITTPGRLIPIQEKAKIKFDQNTFILYSHTDTGSQSPYVIDIKLNRIGQSDISLQFPPHLVGKIGIDGQSEGATLRADFETKDKRKITAFGTVTTGVKSLLNLEIALDAERNPEVKVSLKGSMETENDGSVKQRAVMLNINYLQAVQINVYGTINDDFISGPHNLRADFSGNVEPTSVVINHTISNGNKIASFVQYLRGDVEKLRIDMRGKYIRRGYNLDLEAGLSTKSPFKTFDGKEVYYKLYVDSRDASRAFATEYRIKHAVSLGYVGKVEYHRKRGWPGSIKTIIVFMTDDTIVYEEKSSLDYGNGKYRLTTTFSPLPLKKLTLDSSLDISSRYASFHHSSFTSFQRVQTVRLNAVADFRENVKLHTLLDLNNDRIYDFNTTFTSRSITDFEGHLSLSSKITPSLHIRTRANQGNSLTKYTLNVQKGDEDIATANGEIRMRKKGFNGDVFLKYREKELMNMNIVNEVKSQRERNYAIRTKVGSSTYTANIHWVKEKRAIKRVIALCAADSNKCIDISVIHKESEGRNEWQVAYKRENVQLNFERIVTKSNDYSRYYAVVHSGNKRYGYDVRLGREGNPQSFSLGLISPSREVTMEADYNLSFEDFKLKLGVLSDAKKEPNRKLILDVKSRNRYGKICTTATEVSLSHPVLEKPIEVNVIATYDHSNPKPFSMEVTADYSSNPSDKVIVKIHSENSGSDVLTKKLYLNLFHEDDEHLLLTAIAIRSKSADNLHYGLEFMQPANDKNKISLSADYFPKERKVTLLYQRPDFYYKVTAVQDEFPKSSAREVNLEFDSNGEIINSKLVYYRKKNCIHYDFFVPETQFSHKTEKCFDPWSSTLFAVRMETSGEDLELLDNSLEVFQSEHGLRGILGHWSTDFLGIVTFRLMNLIDELANGLEIIFPSDTQAIFKSMEKTVKDKIIEPIKQFSLTESAKFRNDVLTEYKFLSSVLEKYYSLIFSISDAIAHLKPVGLLFVNVVKSTWESINDRFPRLKEYYQIVLEKSITMKEKIWKYCSENSHCSHIITAIIEEDYVQLLKLFQNVAYSLPGKLSNIDEYYEVMKGWMSQAYDHLATGSNYLIQTFEPVLDYPYIRDVVQHFQYMYLRIKFRYGKQIDEMSSKFIEEYRRVRKNVLENEYLLKMIALIKKEFHELKNYLQALNLQELSHSLQRSIEEYLSKSTVPTNMPIASVPVINYDRGTIDVALRNIPDLTFVRDLLVEVLNLYRPPAEIWESASPSLVKTLVANIRRASDLNFYPPYAEQAIIVGNHHFITFDKSFYDFSGQCNYLLARDFDNTNFSLVLKNPEQSVNKGITVLFIVGKTSVEVNTDEKTVKIDGRIVDLPQFTANFTAAQEENTIVVDDRHGVTLKCHLIHELCALVIPGWYFGKTAGLYGTYNYESFDDFKRPRGQVAHNVGNFARSWELDKGCKPKNLVEEDEVAKDSVMYKTCKDIFNSSTSPLAMCFSEVQPNPYFKLCLRHSSGQGDTKKALCSVAAAYVSECEQNYVETNLPSQCLQCEAPDGSSMTHGKRLKFGGSQKKSADIVFVIENHNCNKRSIEDLNAIASSIERELQDAGFQENMYGVVSYGGSEGRPFSHTRNGKAFFGVQDVKLDPNAIKGSEIKYKSLKALEALKYAVRYPFRGDTAKSFVLFSCSPCKYDYKSLEYPVVQQILLDHAINLHVVSDQVITIRKRSAKIKDVIGVDANTVYSSKEFGQKDLVGEPSLRSQVSLPKDVCIALSQDVNGSYFTFKSESEDQQTDLKNWRSLLARRLVKTSDVPGCQFCDCTSTKDHVAKTVCQPCSISRPRLPFSVCKDCTIPRYAEAVVSYLLHLSS